MIKATEILSKILWLYGGAFIPVLLAKLDIVEIDKYNDIMPMTLLFLLTGSIYFLLLALGF